MGDNGTGKSTILDALTFALFGKPYRKINKGQLVNSINKRDCVVEVEFKTGGDDYRVVRGIRPNVFEIHRNGKQLSNSDTRDHQDALEKQVMKFAYKAFCQVVVLGAATFLPFMQLNPGQRREIIEDLLGLQVFTAMNVVLKDRIYLCDARKREAMVQFDHAEHTLSLIKDHKAKLLAQTEVDIEEKRGRIKQSSDFIRDNLLLMETARGELAKVSELCKNLDAADDKQAALVLLKTQIETKRAGLSKDLRFFEGHDTCPTCKQDINDGHRTDTIEEKRREITEIDDGLEKLAVKLKKLTDVDTTPRARRIELNTELELLSSRIDYMKLYVIELETDIAGIKQRSDDVDDTVLEEAEKIAAEQKKRIDELTEEHKILFAASVLLKDSGIKARIVKQYVPIINTLITKYMAAMEFMCRFELDENFNEKIMSRYMDEFSYESFSEGQKQRIDLALLFTWRAIARKRNSVSTNLLVLDEVFDRSLDSDGIEYVASIVKQLSADCGVVVISHRDQMIDKFNGTMKFALRKNFSEVIE